jgi:hypothetical protein
MSYKIEIYFYGSKSKHKLYDSQAAYDKWWAARCKEEKWYKSLNMTYGLRGYVNGALDKEFGDFTPYKAPK